jgi:putative phosphoesterase
MSKLAVLADIHGNLPALQAVIADLARREIDAVVNLGDHASGPLWPHETLALLIEQPWTQIAGNHDRLLVHQPPEQHNLSDQYAFARLSAAQREWLAGLPATAHLDGGILLCHGSPSDDTQYLLETVAHGGLRLARPAEIAERLGEVRARVLLCGHTHIQRVVRLDSAMLIVNPGSVGAPGYQDDTPEPHVVAAGSPHARYALLEERGGEVHTELVALPYDSEAAADQARRNGRPEWEAALRTGFL